MKLTVNGESRDVEAGATLAELLAALGITQNGVAVALNERVVRGGAFADQTLRDGDVVEIIRAVAGG